MKIRHAEERDFNEIEKIYTDARNYMAEHGNPTQWGPFYPDRDVILDDIQRACLYVIVKDEQIKGVFAGIPGENPAYRALKGEWLSTAPYCTLSRIAGSKNSSGILQAATDYLLQEYSSVRTDTHINNKKMIEACLRCGYTQVGEIIGLIGKPRPAFQIIRTA